MNPKSKQQLREQIETRLSSATYADAEQAIDDIMQAFESFHTGEVERAEGIGKYMGCSMLLQNIGYLLEHRRQGGLPEMTAEVIGELYKEVKATMDANEKYMRSGSQSTESDKSPFIDPRDLPKTKLADGTVVTGSRKLVRMKKSRLGRNYNGKHRD